MPEPSNDAEAQPDVNLNVLTATGVFTSNAAITELRLDNGRVMRLPTAALLQSAISTQPAQAITEAQHDSTHVIVPVTEEHLRVDKRVVETGKVRLRKHIQEYEVALDEVLALRSFDVERIVLNQPVENAPPVRQEGKTTIYPVVEEQLILTRQLILKEELRVTPRDTERHDTRPVMLRREIVEIEREPLK